MSVGFGLLVTLGVLLGAACAVQRRLPLQILLPLTVGSVAVYPKMLTGASRPYVGIAPWHMAAHFYTVGTVACLVVCALRGGRALLRMLAPWAPFLVAMLILTAEYWPRDSLTRAGVEHVVESIALFAVAAAGARLQLYTQRAIAILFMAVVAIELAVCVLHTIGAEPAILSRHAAVGFGSRLTGTTTQPDELGKLCWLTLVAFLSYQSARLVERRLQVAAVISALVLLTLSQGRATLVAAGLAFAVAVALQPDRLIRTRGYVISGTGILAFAVVGAPVVGRFINDPEGGGRPILRKLATEIIAHNASTGVGINHYVQKVGSIDALTASGVPVHNSFMLAAAEMGIPAAALLWLPFLALGVVAVRRSRAVGSRGDAARALVGLLLGAYVVGSTGWGLLGSPDMELLFAVSGYLFGSVSREHRDESGLQQEPCGLGRSSLKGTERTVVRDAPDDSLLPV